MRKSYVVELAPEERERLEKLISTGSTKSKRQIRARILLKADTSAAGPGWPDERIAEALEIGVSTVARVRQHFVEQGLAAVVDPERVRRPSRRRLDGEQEARLLALACGPAPQGRTRWTLRLLADQMVELEVVESISHETVRQVLKKTS
jgi:transposase